MRLSHILGQEKLAARFVQAVHRRSVARSVLLCSQQPAQNLYFASAMATYLLCEQVRQALARGQLPTDSCGTCRHCKRADTLNHPDIHYIYPVIDSKTERHGGLSPAEHHLHAFRSLFLENPYADVSEWFGVIDSDNQLGNISAEECDFLSKRVHLKPTEGGVCVYIIWMAEYLGKEGNKLLKTIEEPNADTFFIFISENLDALLPTIRSRLQLWQLFPLSEQHCTQLLCRHFGVAQTQAELLSLLSGADIREAKRLHENAHEQTIALARDFLNLLYKTTAQKTVHFIDQITALDKEHILFFLRSVLTLLRRSLRHYHTPAEGTHPLHELIEKIHTKLSLSHIHWLADRIEHTRMCIERNANIKLTLHATVIGLRKMISDQLALVPR